MSQRELHSFTDYESPNVLCHESASQGYPSVADSLAQSPDGAAAKPITQNPSDTAKGESAKSGRTDSSAFYSGQECPDYGVQMPSPLRNPSAIERFAWRPMAMVKSWVQFVTFVGRWSSSGPSVPIVTAAA